nr:putative late blight resistance protein homolog R1B-17 [Ipomoea batatas]
MSLLDPNESWGTILLISFRLKGIGHQDLKGFRSHLSQCCGEMEGLPQTLVVCGSDSESQLGVPTLHLPSTIWESPQLRHIELGALYTVDPPSVVKKNLQNIILARLKSLTISVSVGCTVTFPEQCVFPSQLKKLSLSGTNLFGRDLTVIGSLKRLEVLKMENAFQEEVWRVVEGGFYGLKYLVLKDKKLKKFEAYTDAFPCLEHLVLRCYHYLEEIPSSFGEIFCLKSIELDRCSRPPIVTSAKDIQEKLNKNFGKANFEVRSSGMIIIFVLCY